MIFKQKQKVELESVGTGRTASSTGLAIHSEVRYSVLRGSLMLVTVCHYLVLNRLVAYMYFWTLSNMATFEANGNVSSPDKSTFKVKTVYCDIVLLRSILWSR